MRNGLEFAVSDSCASAIRFFADGRPRLLTSSEAAAYLRFIDIDAADAHHPAGKPAVDTGFRKRVEAAMNWLRPERAFVAVKGIGQRLRYRPDDLDALIDRGVE